jgi:hypothetical protein
MNPIIGSAGVAALYRRSLVLTGRAHPWLAVLYRDGQTGVDCEGLAATLAAQDSSDAARCGGELLESFYRLLGSLIGPTLTRRLLPFMWQSFEAPIPRESP